MGTEGGGHSWWGWLGVLCGPSSWPGGFSGGGQVWPELRAQPQEGHRTCVWDECRGNGLCVLDDEAADSLPQPLLQPRPSFHCWGPGGDDLPALRGPSCFRVRGAACAGSLATLCSSFALCPQSAVTRCLAVTGLGNPTRCLCCPPSLHPHIADDQDLIGVLPCEQLGWAFTASLTKTKASLSPPTPTCQQSPSPHVTCWVLCAPDGWEGAPVLAETPPAPPSVTGSVTRHTSTADGTAGPTGPWVMAKPRHQNPAEAG